MDSWLDFIKNKIDPDIMEKAFKEEDEGRDVATFLLDNKSASKKDLLSAMSHYYKLPSVDLEYYYPDRDSTGKITEEIARRFLIVPLFQLDDKLYVALKDPDNLTVQNYIRQLTGLEVEPVLSLEPDLNSSINRVYLTKEETAKKMTGYKPEKVEKKPVEMQIRIEDDEAPAIKLVNYMLTQAINLGASDIHLEPFPEKVMLRYRVDGVLHEFPPPPVHIFRAVVSRIKIISNMDVAERRLPQDGRAGININNRDYDLRVSIIPNVNGEGVVIRILDTQGKGKGLDEIGFNKKMLDQYKKLIVRPHGILLVTGPTGSGKSSTLYATLKYIYTPKKKIITLEDPVEYQMEGLTQIAVNSSIGFTFGAGLRAVLRHDPDIVMLGEIRDLESAEIAIKASLTGHLVFSTLHTNDTPSSVTRLIDMGIQSFLVFSSLNGILAQRLVRRLCPSCKVKIDLTEEEITSTGLKSLPPGTEFFGPKGCSACGNLGYKGRIAIHELLEINQKMRRLKPEEVTQEKIRDLALEEGNFMTLRDSAVEKFIQGITSIEEVLSVT
ncbi:MAG: GspE/PulE family protein [Candidatus Eremiobacterota bacterium]